MGTLLLVVQGYLGFCSIYCSAMSLLVPTCWIHVSDHILQIHEAGLRLRKAHWVFWDLGLLKLHPMVHVYEAQRYQDVSLNKVECPNVLELFVFSPPLVVATSQTTTMHRVNQRVYFAGSKCLIIIIVIINVLKCSTTIPFWLRQQSN